MQGVKGYERERWELVLFLVLESEDTGNQEAVWVGIETTVMCQWFSPRP